MTEMTVEDAEREAAEAESLATELEERVRQGDEDVTPEAIADAERLGRFARLRVEAARRKAEGRRRTAALEAAEEFKARLIESAASKDAALVKAWAGLVDALREVNQVAEERYAEVDEQVRERSDVGLRVRTEAGVEIAELGILPGRYNEWGYQLPEQSIDVRQVQPHEVIAEALAVALPSNTRSQLARTGSSAERLEHLPGSTRVTGVVGWPDAARKALEKGTTR